VGESGMIKIQMGKHNSGNGRSVWDAFSDIIL
jgi:hypothetical protein